MKLFSSRTVVVNPPIELSGFYIDNPAFSFLQANVFFQFIANENPSTFYVDAFLEGGVKRNGDKIHFGCDKESLLDRIVAFDPEVVIINYSNYQRARGLYNSILHFFVTELSNRSIDVQFADMYDTSTHYLDYDEKVLRLVYPSLGKVFRGELNALATGGNVRAGSPNSSTEKSGEYKDWLGSCLENDVIKDCEGDKSAFPYLSSVGCPYNCLFCKQKGDSWTGLRAEVVCRDMDILKNKGFQCIHVIDPYVNYDESRFKSILTHCADNEIELHFSNGVGLKHLDRESAGLLSQVTSKIFVSPESVSDSSLGTLRKPFDREDVKEKLQLLSDSGCKIHAHFIHNIPNETRSELNEKLSEVSNMVADYNVEPHFQCFVSRDEMFVDKTRASNIYEKFLPQKAEDNWSRIAINNFHVRNNYDDQKKIIINVSYRCNNKCTFCAVADRPREDGDLKVQLETVARAYSEGTRLLDLDGGEPLMYNGLFEILEAARGFSRVNITTNGRILAYQEFVKNLSKFKNVQILISLHSAQREIHNRLTRSDQSYDETVRGIRNAVQVFDNVGVNTTLTSDNYLTLEATADLVANIGAGVFNIQWYTPFGVVDKNNFPPKDAVSLVRKVVKKHRSDLKINLVNFRYCQAPDLYEHMVGDFYKASREMLFADGNIVNLSEYLASERFKNKGCNACECDVVCQGHWKHSNDMPGVDFARHQEKKHISLLDIIPGYACNGKCIFCAGIEEMRSINLKTKEVFERIDTVLKDYIPRAARIGGGEPTIRKDLVAIVKHLRINGIDRVTIQTNGMALFYEAYLEKLIDAGLTGINFSIPGDESSLENLNKITGSFDLVRTALCNSIQREIDVEIDLLVSKPVLGNLMEIVEGYKDLGVRRINFWYIAIEGNAAQNVELLVPSVSLAGAHLDQIMNKIDGIVLRSYYLPYCVQKENLEKIWHPLEENAYVITPETSFFLDAGQIEQGVHTAKCSECAVKKYCCGLRKNYLDLFGDNELGALN